MLPMPDKRETITLQEPLPNVLGEIRERVFDEIIDMDEDEIRTAYKKELTAPADSSVGSSQASRCQLSVLQVHHGIVVRVNLFFK